MTDQWRASALGYAGDPNVQTPQLDSFAKKAFNFVNAVSVCPVCTPYRASIMTGRYPTSTGMFLNDLYLPAEELCIAEVLKSEGYNTGYIGKWHLDGHGRLGFTPPQRRQGFDYWLAIECSHQYNKMPYYENASREMKFWEGYSPFALSRAAQDFINDQQNSDDPFFLFVSMATPHFPHETAPEEFKKLYSTEGIKLNPNVPKELDEQVRNELVGYYAHCTATDAAIGDLLKKIEELDLMENTIVVFTADHGEAMGAHGIDPKRKHTAFRETANVPFLIHVPGMENKGMKVELPITTPDISATLLSLAGIGIPDSFEGIDCSGSINGNNDINNRAALFMSVAPFSKILEEYKRAYRAIKTSRYTYVRDTAGAWLLFDDLTDPYQMNNLVGNDEYFEVQKELEAQLMSELNRINDAFQPASFYIEEWGYTVEPEGHILYESHNSVVQTPKR